MAEYLSERCDEWPCRCRTCIVCGKRFDPDPYADLDDDCYEPRWIHLFRYTHCFSCWFWREPDGEGRHHGEGNLLVLVDYDDHREGRNRGQR